MVIYEYGIIGCLLVDGDKAMKKCYGRIKEDMFSNPLCAEAYKEIVRANDLGEKISLSLLEPKLTDDLTKREEVYAFLKDCVSEASFDELNGYIKSLTDEYKVTKIREICNSVSTKPVDVENSLKTMIEELTALNDTKQTKGRSMSQITASVKDNYFVEHETGIKTGFYCLDEIITGLTKGDVTILGARPAVGKSALATQILTNVALKGKRVGYFNLEMSDEQIYERMLASRSGIDMTRIRRAVVKMPDEAQSIDEANEKLAQLNNLIVFSGSYTASEIRQHCKNQQFDLVVVDYLQIVKPDKSYSSRVSEVGDISKTIKGIAMELKIPVLALSQLNRKKSSTDEPEMNDLRESGDIEQDASTIIFMWNIDDDGEYKGIKVDKNRQGGLGKVAMKFEGKHMKFIPTTESFEKIEKMYRSSKSSYNDDPNW